MIPVLVTMEMSFYFHCFVFLDAFSTVVDSARTVFLIALTHEFMIHTCESSLPTSLLTNTLNNEFIYNNECAESIQRMSQLLLR